MSSLQRVEIVRDLAKAKRIILSIRKTKPQDEATQFLQNPCYNTGNLISTEVPFWRIKSERDYSRKGRIVVVTF